jgi:hypothetical protein
MGRSQVAILVVAEFPGGTAEQDAAMVKMLNLQASPPIGVRVRAAGPTADGWRVVTLWDSQEQFERFRDETFLPAIKGTGRTVPSIEIWPIETVLTL